MSEIDNITVREKMPFGLKAIAFSLFLLPLCRETAFTFQSIFYVMGLILIYGVAAKIKPRKDSVRLVGCFLLITAVGYLHALVITPQIVTATSLIRVFLFMAILLVYVFVVSTDYTPLAISKALRMTALSAIVSCSLVIARYVMQGFYEGRIYPVSFLGITIDANFYALVIVFQASISFLIALYELSIARKAVYLALFAACCLAIMLTGSRSGLLCICVSCAIQLIVYATQHAEATFPTVVLISVLAIVLLALVWNFVSDWLLDRFFAESYNDGSNQFRLLLWRNALIRVLGRPLAGFGVGNYTYYSAQDWNRSSVSNAAHGTFVDYLVDFGVVGLIAFCYLVFSPIKRLAKHGGAPFLGVAAGFLIAAFIVGAERTVVLWVFIIEFDIASRVMERTGVSTLELINSDKRVGRKGEAA